MFARTKLQCVSLCVQLLHCACRQDNESNWISRKYEQSAASICKTHRAIQSWPDFKTNKNVLAAKAAVGLHFLKIYIVLDKIGKFWPPAFFERDVSMYLRRIPISWFAPYHRLVFLGTKSQYIIFRGELGIMSYFLHLIILLPDLKIYLFQIRAIIYTLQVVVYPSNLSNYENNDQLNKGVLGTISGSSMSMGSGYIELSRDTQPPLNTDM